MDAMTIREIRHSIGTMPSPDPPARSGKTASAGPPSAHAHLSNPPMPTTFKLDEGYSEETRSQAGSDSAFQSPSRLDEMALAPTELGIPSWITTMGEVERSGTYAGRMGCCTAFSFKSLRVLVADL